MVYKLVPSELQCVEDYDRSFENSFAYFATFYQKWKETAEVDWETGYVSLSHLTESSELKIENEQKTEQKINVFMHKCQT